MKGRGPNGTESAKALWSDMRTRAMRCFWFVGAAVIGTTLIPWLRAQPAPTQTFDLGGGQALEVRLVQAGRFTQGSPDSEANRSDEEYQRTVTLSKDYYLGTTEVTVGQFTRFASTANYRTEAEKGESGGFGWDGTKLVQRRDFNWRNPGFPQNEKHPVTLVTYDDALAFCAWLRQRTGQPFDLPSEAQWEYAARAGQDLAWPGSSDPDTVAWHKGNTPTGTKAVGLLKANAWGFFDLGGNAAEWCRDWYGPYLDGGAAGLVDPIVSTPPGGDKPRRVLRGGSWLREAKHARVAARYRNDPKSRNADNGFRVYLPVRTVPAANVPQPPANAAPNPTDPVLAVPPSARRANPQAPIGQVGPTLKSYGIGSTVFGLLCPMACVGGVVILLVVLIRKMRAGKSPTIPGSGASRSDAWAPARVVPPSAIRTEMRDDGFNMLLTGVAVGELVRYVAEVAGQQLTDTVVYQPGPTGQFIYTGARPDSVKILGIASGSESELPGQTSIHDLGPGGVASAGAWMSQGGGFGRSPSSPLSSSSHRRPGAYE